MFLPEILCKHDFTRSTYGHQNCTLNPNSLGPPNTPKSFQSFLKTVDQTIRPVQSGCSSIHTKTLLGIIRGQNQKKILQNPHCNQRTQSAETEPETQPRRRLGWLTRTPTSVCRFEVGVNLTQPVRAYPAGAGWGLGLNPGCNPRGRVQGGGSNNLNLRLWVGLTLTLTSG